MRKSRCTLVVLVIIVLPMVTCNLPLLSSVGASSGDDSAPSICDFDGLFKLNNARMIYPSDQTPKPLGCSPASVSDWTASAFISTKLENATEGTDTDSAFVNQSSGKPVGAERTGIVSFGGPVVNPVVAYAESALNSNWRQSSAEILRRRWNMLLPTS